ncbi:arsenate reductase ArsC [Sulfurimonas marina]|uniref:arsenate reductase ArsC n=1 Tax=Sulfurimonas marina TaxID=2590551 RepID=UPI003D34DABE
MNKKVLILCTGNSCRSIMAEALINAKLGECVEAQSSGVKASGTVNPNAQALLESKGYWRDEYHSKVIETVLDTPFDLVVTVCDHAKETCPMFPKAVKTIHIGFDDPSGKAVEEYEKTLNLIEKELLPVVKEELC